MTTDVDYPALVEEQGLSEHWVPFIEQRIPTLIKLCMIGAMICFSVATLSGSLFKGAVIGFTACLIGVFSVWRRYLEIVSFWLFAGCIAMWCGFDLPEKIKLAVFAH